LKGIPTEKTIASQYWRKRFPPPKRINPNDDHCGVLWSCVLIPFSGELIVDTLETIETIILEHGYEPNIGFMIANARCVRIFTSILYDRELNNEDKKVQNCYHKLSNFYTSKGLSQNRVDINTKNNTELFDAETISFLSELKKKLDPDQVMSLNKYDYER